VGDYESGLRWVEVKLSMVVQEEFSKLETMKRKSKGSESGLRWVEVKN